MPRHERRNIFFGPRPESARVLWTLALVADGWVDTDDAAGDGEGHEAAQGPQHVGLRMRPERIEDPRDVARLHHGQPLIAVLGREALEQRAPHPLCGGRELVAELLRIEIGGDNRIHAARWVVSQMSVRQSSMRCVRNCASVTTCRFFSTLMFQPRGTLPKPSHCWPGWHVSLWPISRMPGASHRNSP